MALSPVPPTLFCCDVSKRFLMQLYKRESLYVYSSKSYFGLPHFISNITCYNIYLSFTQNHRTSGVASFIILYEYSVPFLTDILFISPVLSLSISFFFFFQRKKKKAFDLFLLEVSIPPELPMPSPNNSHTTSTPISFPAAGQSRTRQASSRAPTRLPQEEAPFSRLRGGCQFCGRADKSHQFY